MLRTYVSICNSSYVYTLQTTHNLNAHKVNNMGQWNNASVLQYVTGFWQKDFLWVLAQRM